MHLEVLWRFKGHQVREELQQKHQRLFTVGMVAAASAETHLKQNNTGFFNWNQPSGKISCTLLKHFWSQPECNTPASSHIYHSGLEKSNMQPWTSRCRRGSCRVPPVRPVEPIGRQLSCSPGRSPQTQRSAGGIADLSVADVLDKKEKLSNVLTMYLLVQWTTAGMFFMLKVD